MLAVVDSRNDDVTAFYKSNLGLITRVWQAAENLIDPWPRRIDDRSCVDAEALATADVAAARAPVPVHSFSGEKSSPREYTGTVPSRVERVQHDEPAVVDGAVRVRKAVRNFLLERRA